MKTLEIRRSTLRDAFALFGLIFYMNVIYFFMALSSSSRLRGMQNDSEGNVVNQVCGLITFAVPLYLFIKHKIYLRKSFYQQNLVFIFFLSTVLLSVFWSHEPSISLKRFIAMLSTVFFAGFIVYHYRVQQIAFTVGCMIGLFSLMGLALALVFPEHTFAQEGARQGAFKGIFPEKNAGARINAIAILLLLPYVYRQNRLALVCAFFSLVAVILAKSATGLVLIFAGAASYWYFLTLVKLRINKSRSVFLISTLIYILIFLLIYANYELFLSTLGRDSTLTDRTRIWELLAPSIDAEYIKGYGFGAFWFTPSADYFLQRWGYIGNAHSGYKETLLNGGIIQLVALIALFFHALLKQYKIINSSFATQYHVGALVIIALMIISNYVAYVIPNYRSTEFLIFCILIISFRNPSSVRNAYLDAQSVRLSSPLR
ncbi:O-antigen ligase family protein [Pseudomonas sp. B392_1p]|uniref:O-antigen ligase family protein n=1 Tax=Pseudomonas sp. B392_1p TaxID=3457507 RepID=UPI003FD1FB2E